MAFSPDTKKSTYNPTSPAVVQAARLLVFLGGQSAPSLGLTEICNNLGIHKSKGFSILNSLAAHDLITKDSSTKTYSLGPALMPLARKASETFDITAIAKAPLETLAVETETTLLLGIISKDQFYISGKYDGNTMLSVTVKRYQSLSITHGAHGKAIFPFLEASKQERILETGPLFFHGKTGEFNRERLDREISACRMKGYAVDNGELAPGIRAVAAPVFDHGNQVVAAIVSAGVFPEKRIDTLGPQVAKTAAMISRKAGADLFFPSNVTS